MPWCAPDVLRSESRTKIRRVEPVIPPQLWKAWCTWLLVNGAACPWHHDMIKLSGATRHSWMWRPAMHKRRTAFVSFWKIQVKAILITLCGIVFVIFVPHRRYWCLYKHCNINIPTRTPSRHKCRCGKNLMMKWLKVQVHPAEQQRLCFFNKECYFHQHTCITIPPPGGGGRDFFSEISAFTRKVFNIHPAISYKHLHFWAMA